MSQQESDALENWIATLRQSFPPAVQQEFGVLEQLALHQQMLRCHMAEYPAVNGDPHGERSSGFCVCERCGQEYGDHPYDWRIIGYGNVPFLTVLCDGRRVKL